jgi:hypothetical protein
MVEETKSRFTPEQMAYLKEKVKIAKERASTQREAERKVTDFKITFAQKKARAEGIFQLKRPSRAQMFAGGLSLGSSLMKRGGKAGKAWLKTRKNRKASALESHYAKINRRMGV